MNLTATLDVLEVDPALPRLTPDAEIKRLPLYLRVTLKALEGSSLVVVGSKEPSDALRGMPWMRTDGAGRPAGWFVLYNGSYVKLYDLGVNAVVGFTGSSSYPAAPWYFCDGSHGTPDLRKNMVKSDGTSGDPATAAQYSLGYMQYQGYI